MVFVISFVVVSLFIDALSEHLICGTSVRFALWYLFVSCHTGRLFLVGHLLDGMVFVKSFAVIALCSDALIGRT